MKTHSILSKLASTFVASGRRWLFVAFSLFGMIHAFGAAPDLTFAGSISVSPNPIVRGNEVTVSYTIKNIGNATAADSQTKIQLKPAGSSVTTVETIQKTTSLAAGASRSKTATIKIDAAVAAGNYTVFVTLDYDNNIGQSDSSVASDQQQTALTIQATSAPDLTFDGSIGVSPNPIVRGKEVTVSYKIKNTGNANASDSRTRIWMTPAGSNAVTTETFQTTTSLAAGASRSKTATIKIDAGVAAGNYTVHVHLDCDQNIGQSDQSDASDVRTTGLTIQTAAAPDLTFDGSIGVSPNPIKTGNEVTVSYKIKNVGNASAPDSRTRIWMTPVGSDVLTAETFQKTTSLATAASRSKTATIKIGTAVAAGNYIVHVTLDCDNDIGQSDESAASDLRSTGLTIEATAAPDLTFDGSIGVSPNPVARGNDITVSYTIKNIGTALASESRTRIQVKPAGSTSAIVDFYQTTSSLAAGDSRSKTAKATIDSTVAAGKYTVYVVIDADNNIGTERSERRQ